MKAAGWLRFTWEAKGLPPASYLITEQYTIRKAARPEKSQIWQLINSSFLLDTCWNGVFNDLVTRLHHDLEEKFNHREIDCMVITHGNRIVAASLFHPALDADNHLLSGPCVSSEYRNRGFGVRLLKESLSMVARNGNAKILGITLASSPAARFVYPKFGGIACPYEMPVSDIALAH